MCAKKLRYPPPLDSDGPKVSKPKPGEKFDFGLKQAQDKPTKPKERPRTYKPRLAFYLLLGVTFMVMFEIIMVLGTGEDYRYSSIHRDKNDLEGTIFEGETDRVIAVEEVNITLENHDTEFNYFFNTEKIGKKIYETGLNNTTGEYKFSNIPCGRYIINISIPGYRPEHRKVVIVPEYVDPDDEENIEDFHLTKLGPGDPADNVKFSGDFKNESLDNYIEATYICFLIIGIFVILMVLGMINCFRSKRYSLAVAGAIFGILAGLITVYSLGSFIAVGALIFIMMAKEEFES